jgi:hypothetical protein
VHPFQTEMFYRSSSQVPFAAATAFVVDVLGERFVSDLVQTLLDHEVPPTFMWHGDPPPVAEKAAQARTKVDAALRELDTAETRRLVESLEGQLFKDLAEALVQAAVGSAYFALPDSLLRTDLAGSRVLDAVPDLAERVDDDGLIDTSGLRATPQCLFMGPFAIAYHQFLRRSFSSHTNDALLAELIRGVGEGNWSLRLAIDDRRVCRAADHRDRQERDYWWGPHLSDAVLDDTSRPSPETTVHSWNDVASRMPWDPSEKVVVRWTTDGSIRTVQMEETIDPDVARQPSSTVLLRYLHARRDTETHEFIHCDGAVRAYSPDGYAVRRDEDWPAEGLSEGYRKVWRIDGHIATDAWSQIVALWLRGNPLAGEYLITAEETVGGKPGASAS